MLPKVQTMHPGVTHSRHQPYGYGEDFQSPGAPTRLYIRLVASVIPFLEKIRLKGLGAIPKVSQDLVKNAIALAHQTG